MPIEASAFLLFKKTGIIVSNRGNNTLEYLQVHSAEKCWGEGDVVNNLVVRAGVAHMVTGFFVMCHSAIDSENNPLDSFFRGSGKLRNFYRSKPRQ